MDLNTIKFKKQLQNKDEKNRTSCSSSLHFISLFCFLWSILQKAPLDKKTLSYVVPHSERDALRSKRLNPFLHPDLNLIQ